MFVLDTHIGHSMNESQQLTYGDGVKFDIKSKGKVIPLQARCGTESG